MGHRFFVENEYSPFTFTEYVILKDRMKALKGVTRPYDMVDMTESDSVIVVVWNGDDSITLYKRPYRNVFHIMGKCFRDFSGKWVLKSFIENQYLPVDTNSDVETAIIRTPMSQRTLDSFIIADSYFFPCT